MNAKTQRTTLERAIEKALVLIDRNENTDAEDILEKALEGE